MIRCLPWGYSAGAAANKHEKQCKLNTNCLGQKGEIAVSIRILVKQTCVSENVKRYAEGKASDIYTKNRISEKYVQYSRLKPKRQSRATRSEENLH